MSEWIRDGSAEETAVEADRVDVASGPESWCGDIEDFFDLPEQARSALRIFEATWRIETRDSNHRPSAIKAESQVANMYL